VKRVHAILLAAGDGNRFGAEMPKQFVRLAGEQILARSLRAIAAVGIDRLVVVANASWVAETQEVVDAVRLSVPTTVVVGGATRNESTLNGLRALDAADDDVVVVHDAVRPLVPLDVFTRAIDPVAAGDADATDTVIASADTLVVVDGPRVVEIPERSRYRRGQTPQVFRMDVLSRAYDAALAAGDMKATDDCGLVLRYVPGVRLLAVAGDDVNLKITTRIDLVLADRMLQIRTLALDTTSDDGRLLDGARLLVIGGTNGIGRAIADEAERQGGRVAIDGRSLGLDIRDAGGVSARIDAVAARLGGLDHVVVTAGVLRVGRLDETAAEDLAEVIDVNLTGTLNVARAAYPHLRAAHGSLTVFASSSFTVGRPNYVAYSASKAALVNVAQGLADEWCDDGIRVNAVSPERTDTPMRRRAFPAEPTAGMLRAEEVAAATIALLRSDLTGQVLDVKRHDAVAMAQAEVADRVVTSTVP
jgi:ribitol-5-phosphate 2-dehydrogenase (NADP+) / D-ribitol-5-phosphate cytidylyltransferase